MPQREDWEIDMDDAIKKEEWRPTGPNRPIKVVPAERPLESDVCGYFTLGKYLLRKTPEEIERDLGFPRDFLKHGARLYKFARLPQVSEYEYELTADHPDGLADQGPFPRKIYYPPGSQKIKQWRILKGKIIPVDPKYFTVRPTFHLPESWLTKA
jgi:hypothetical protein